MPDDVWLPDSVELTRFLPRRCETTLFRDDFKRSHEGASMSHQGPLESKCLKVTFSPKKQSESTSGDEVSKRGKNVYPVGIHLSNDDVLSVVIDKLTELVNDSEKSQLEGLSGRSNPVDSSSNKRADQLYKCPRCPCLFASSPKQLKDEELGLCKCCKKSQNAANDRLESYFAKHQQTEVISSEEISCELCQHVSFTHVDLLYHFTSKHANAKICKCKLCDYFTTDALRIKRHAAVHTAPHLYRCSSCSFITEKLVALQDHLKDHNKDQKLLLKCSECGFSCQCEDVLRTHMWEHIPSSHTASPARQESPSPGDNASRAPKMHHESVKRKSPNPPTVISDEQPIFKCLLCGYFCARLATLKAHAWRHAGEKGCSYPVVDEDECLKQMLSIPPTRVASSRGETSAILRNVEVESGNYADSIDLDTDKVITSKAACKSTTCGDCYGPSNSKEVPSSDCCCKGINIPSSVSVIKQLLTQKKHESKKQNTSWANEVGSKESSQHNGVSQSKTPRRNLNDASVTQSPKIHPEIAPENSSHSPKALIVPSDPNMLVFDDNNGQIPEPAFVVEAVTENYIAHATELDVTVGVFAPSRKSKKRPYAVEDCSFRKKTKSPSSQHACTSVISDSFSTTTGHEGKQNMNDMQHENEIQCSITSTKDSDSAADDQTDSDLGDSTSSSVKTLTLSHHESRVSASSARQLAVQGAKSELKSQGKETHKSDSFDGLLTMLKLKTSQQTILPHREATEDKFEQTKEPLLIHVPVKEETKTGFMLKENLTKLPSKPNTGTDRDLQKSPQSKPNKANKHVMEERLNEIVKRAKRACDGEDKIDVTNDKEQGINTKSLNGRPIETDGENQRGRENDALQNDKDEDPVVKYFMNIVDGSSQPYQCKLCNESFTGYNLLKQHLQTHLVHHSFRCPLCKQSFESLNCLRQHIQEHYQETHRCQECFAFFHTKFELEEHQQQSHKGLREFSCEVCKVTITGQAGYVNHLENVHSTHQKIPPRCTHCGEVFENTHMLLLHTISCAKRKMWSCKECGCSCQTNEALQDHVKVCHLKPKMYKCDLCDYESSAKHGIKNHMKFHAKTKPYKCHLCSFTGAYPQSLRSHMKMHTQPDWQPECPQPSLPEQYMCKLCYYTCNYLPSLKSHMWRHASNPDYSYKGSQTTDKSPSTAGDNTVPTLQAATHQDPHQKPEAVVNSVTFCCQECGFQSQDRDNLIEHLKTHLAPKKLTAAQTSHNRK